MASHLRHPGHRRRWAILLVALGTGLIGFALAEGGRDRDPTEDAAPTTTALDATSAPTVLGEVVTTAPVAPAAAPVGVEPPSTTSSAAAGPRAAATLRATTSTTRRLTTTTTVATTTSTNPATTTTPPPTLIPPTSVENTTTTTEPPTTTTSTTAP